MTSLILVIVMVAVVAINLLLGGFSMWQSLPCYAILALAAIFSAFPVNRGITLPRPTMWCLWASAAFFGFVLVRTLLSPAEYLARHDLFMALGALILYLLVSLRLTSANMRGSLVALLLTLAIAHSVVGAIQFTKGNEFMPFKDLPRLMTYGTRASGFFDFPNHLAAFLEVTMLLGLGMTIWSRWHLWAKLLLGYASLVCLAGMVITGSRGGYVSTLAGLLVFAVLSLLIVARRSFDRLAGVLGVAALIFLALGAALYLSLGQSLSISQRALTATTQDVTRLRLFTPAIQQFRLSPIVGTGAGTYSYYAREFRDPLFQGDPKYVHNDYLQLLAEFGILGAAGFLLFLILHLRNGWTTFSTLGLRQNYFEGVSNTSLALTIGALSSLAAIMVHSAVDYNLHLPANALLLAFVFGILANPGSGVPVALSEPAVVLPRPVQLILPALGLWIAVAGWSKIPGEYFAWKARVALGDWTTLDTGEYAERAAQFARRGLDYDPKNTDLLSHLGHALFEQAELNREPAERERLLQESIDAYQRALKLAPQDRNFALGLGSSLDALKRFDESDPVFERALALDPNSGYVRWAYARHLHLRGRLVEAEAEYRKAIPLRAPPVAGSDLERVREEMKARGLVPAQPPNP